MLTIGANAELPTPRTPRIAKRQRAQVTLAPSGPPLHVTGTTGLSRLAFGRPAAAGAG
jgi:hypothetical protein